jgi:hypothetical protein
MDLVLGIGGLETSTTGISTWFRFSGVFNPFEKLIQVFLPIEPVVVYWMAVLSQLA